MPDLEVSVAFAAVSVDVDEMPSGGRLEALPPAALAAPPAPAKAASLPGSPKSVRVAASRALRQPDNLRLAMRGDSHSFQPFGVHMQIAGNVTIQGPAVITKRGGRLVCEVLPGGHLDTQQHERVLTGVQEVLGDAQGRMMCSLAAQHVEVCGAMIHDPSIPYIPHRGKKVLTVSKMKDGDAVLLGTNGRMAYPVNISRDCTDCGGDCK